MPNVPGRRRCHSKKCSLPASADCWFSEDSREQLRAYCRILGQHPEIKGAFWLLVISLSSPPATDHRHLCLSSVRSAGHGGRVTHQPRGPEGSPALVSVCTPVQWDLRHQKPLSFSSSWTLAFLKDTKKTLWPSLCIPSPSYFPLLPTSHFGNAWAHSSFLILGNHVPHLYGILSHHHLDQILHYPHRLDQVLLLHTPMTPAYTSVMVLVKIHYNSLLVLLRVRYVIYFLESHCTMHIGSQHIFKRKKLK